MKRILLSLAAVVAVAAVLKQAGIKAYMWITITDEGAPPEVLFNTIPGVTGIPVRYDDVTESDGKK